MSDSVVPLWFHFTSLFGVMLLASYLCGRRLAKIISLADAQLKAEREKALREAADMLASDAAYWGDEAENASTRHLTEMYSGKAVACQECKDVIEALISEVATKEPSSNP